MKEGTIQSRQLSQMLQKILAKAGTLTRDRWIPRKPIKVGTIKWYIQVEVCGLTKKEKKLATVIVGHFSLYAFLRFMSPSE